jgi:hypothetical protein
MVMPLPFVSLNFLTAASRAPFCGSLVSACHRVRVTGPVMSRSASVVAAALGAAPGALPPQAATSSAMAAMTLSLRIGSSSYLPHDSASVR